MRTQLWQNVRDALASSQQALLTGASSHAACGQAELEAVENLKLNMETYLDAYGHMLRDWTMVILTPFQVQDLCHLSASKTSTLQVVVTYQEVT